MDRCPVGQGGMTLNEAYRLIRRFVKHPSKLVLWIGGALLVVASWFDEVWREFCNWFWSWF